MRRWLKNLSGTEWSGRGELWLDPDGNNSEKYDCELNIGIDAIHYSWVYEGQRIEGSFSFNEGGAIWVDGWHQKGCVHCANESGVWGIFTVRHTYAVPGNPDWGWRSQLSQRPNGSLVLQMTNIAPWGEEGRAVRMVFTRDNAQHG